MQKGFFSEDLWLVKLLSLAAFGAFGFFTLLSGPVAENLMLVKAAPDSQVAAVSQVTYPALQSATGLTNPTVAVNSGNYCYWCSTQAFVNYFDWGKVWMADKNGAYGGYSEGSLRDLGLLDENGWVKGLPADAKSYGPIWTFPGSSEADSLKTAAGRYHFFYEGEASIRFAGNSKVVSQEPGHWVIDIDPSGIQSTFILFSNVDPNHTGNYLRNMALVKEENLDLYFAGAMFDPAYLNKIQDFRQMRYLTANGNKKTEWSQEQMNPDYYRMAESYITYVRLANEAGMDPWFTIPFGASDDYVQKLAEYVKANLDPKLVASFELSNEMWNWSFSQTKEAHQLAIARWNLDPNNAGSAWLSYYGMRTYQVMKIVTDVYGSEVSSRVKRVIGTQAVNASISTRVLEATDWKNNEPDAYVPPYTMVDELAMTSYFGWSLITSSGQRTAFLEALADPTVDINQYLYDVMVPDVAAVNDYFVKQKAIAEKYNLDLVLYEGGQHVHHSFATGLSDDQLAPMQEALIQFVRSPEMAKLYEQLWDEWEAIGDGPFMQLGDIGMPSKTGSWGLYATLDDSTPRSDMLEKLNATRANWWDNRSGVQFQQGRIVNGTDSNNTLTGTVQEDYLIAGAGDDTIYPGPANDGVNGGEGTDTVYLKGNRSQYTVTPKWLGYQVVGPDGTDYLYAVEQVQFADGRFAITDLSTPITGGSDPVVETPTEPATTTNPGTTDPGTTEEETALFKVGDLVRTTAATSLYKTVDGNTSGSLAVGTRGKIQRVTTNNDGTVWYRVAFVGGGNGYVPQSVLEGYTRSTKQLNKGGTDQLYAAATDLDKSGVDDDVEENISVLQNQAGYAALKFKQAKVQTFDYQTEADLTDDTNYTYPAGLYDFTATVEPGGSETVTLYLDKKYSTNNWTYRKYNNGQYTDMSSYVTYGTATIDGKTVTTVTYTITDNGPLDTDSRSGYIADPAGPAVSETETTTTTTTSSGQSGAQPTRVRTTTNTTSQVPAGYSFAKNISFAQPQYNDSEEVKMLQTFLNEYEGEALSVTGTYDTSALAAIKRFQEKYRRQILDVWNLAEATGYVGMTTRLKMNNMIKGDTAVCPAFTEYNGGNSGVTQSAEIGKTQEILKELGMYAGPINNTWDAATTQAMITFQETFREVMLDPWSISAGTGYKYKTTNKFLNYFAGCDTGSVYLEGVGNYEGI